MARGRLRIYLGASPGVGKTYEMLVEGHRRADQGADCVIGFVEPHGRRATAAMADGLEVVPRRLMSYRGAELPEMDLDAVLARRPQVALVDELAHTNVPGSGHAKRWQDVADLLAAGIDVVSRVNVQHLESLNDVVAEMTGVTQRETVPDEVVRQADELELAHLAGVAWTCGFRVTCPMSSPTPRYSPGWSSPWPPTPSRSAWPVRRPGNRGCRQSEVNGVTADQGCANLVGERGRYQPLLQCGTRLGAGPHQEPALEHTAVFHQ